MKSFTSIIFLLLFAASLAVPGFIFYTKWTNKKAADEALLTPSRNASASSIFGGRKTSSDPDGAAALPPAPDRIPPLSQAGADAAAEEGPDGAPVRSVPAGSEVPARETAPEAPRPANADGRWAAYFGPKSGRDPMVTPAEYAGIRAEEEKRRRAERLRELERLRREKADSGENRINLQGIVGKSVIIDGKMYSRGNTVHGVKILTIGPDYIIGLYKNKRFKKSLR